MSRHPLAGALIGVILAVTGLAVGRGPAPESDPAGLLERTSGPDRGTSAIGHAHSSPAEAPLLLGVVDFYNPRLMYLKYQPLVDHLSEHTGRRWELAIGADYQETVDALCHDRVAVAYLGPLTFVRAHAACGVEPVVRLNTAGKATYQSLIMVRSDSQIQTLKDLRGRRFGFGAPLSTSSHLMPRAMLLDAGIGPGEIECFYFAHHERAVRAVKLGEVDACGVRDIVGERFVQQGLRVLARSEGIPNFPLAMSPGAGPELRASVERALVKVPQEDRWRAQHLQRWDVEFRHGFAVASDADYDPVRALAVRVLGPEALRLGEDALRCERAGP